MLSAPIYFHIHDGKRERKDVIGVIGPNTIVVYNPSKRTIWQETVKNVQVINILKWQHVHGGNKGNN